MVPRLFHHRTWGKKNLRTNSITRTTDCIYIYIYIYIYTICTLLCIHCILPNIEFFPNKPWWTALNLLIPALWGEFSPGEPSKTPLSHPKNWLLIGYMMGVSTNGGIIGYMMGYIYTIHLYRYGCLFIVIGLDGEILAALFVYREHLFIQLKYTYSGFLRIGVCPNQNSIMEFHRISDIFQWSPRGCEENTELKLETWGKPLTERRALCLNRSAVTNDWNPFFQAWTWWKEKDGNPFYQQAFDFVSDMESNHPNGLCQSAMEWSIFCQKISTTSEYGWIWIFHFNQWSLGHSKTALHKWMWDRRKII